MTEVKPKIGSYLTLAEFATAKELKIVDLASDPITLRDACDGPTDEERDVLVWQDIDDAFSKPVTDSDDIADYAPTQVVAEAFRRAGYDGIRYKSKLVEFDSPELAQDLREATRNNGRNIALFDRNSAEFKTSKLYRFAINGRGTFDFIPVNEPVLCSDPVSDRA